MSSTLIDRLLENQRILTPAARFARSGPKPGRNGRHRDLIPLSAPRRGEQYAFEVNLDQCTGCKACVAACHNLNGLDESETWREVGMLLTRGPSAPAIQTVTSACHHCADPGCLEGCPVLAYEKDEETGIVRHLDDQCIGCQYCVMKCPYEVPKYSKRLGIVRKCDMCHDRLTAGEAPACAQACPTSAIAIRVVKLDDARARAAALDFLPDSPDPRLTVPTTRYVSAKPLPQPMIAADHNAPVVQHMHAPLVFMLVLTQAGWGLLAGSGGNPAGLAWSALLVAAGLTASVMHLGQPLRAWRAFLGWRTSWLSREIMALGAFVGVLVPMAAASWVFPSHPFPNLANVAYGIALVLGAAGVACSAWVYHDTGRAVWRGFRSFGRFFWTPVVFALPSLLPLVLGGKLLWEWSMVRSPRNTRPDATIDDLAASSMLTRGPLRRWWRARLAFGLLAIGASFWHPVAGLALALPGELAERALFFLGGRARKMPGPGL